jgi:hypothetical protein
MDRLPPSSHDKLLVALTEHPLFRDGENLYPIGGSKKYSTTNNSHVDVDVRSILLAPFNCGALSRLGAGDIPAICLLDRVIAGLGCRGLFFRSEQLPSRRIFWPRAAAFIRAALSSDEERIRAGFVRQLNFEQLHSGRGSNYDSGGRHCRRGVRAVCLGDIIVVCTFGEPVFIKTIISSRLTAFS